MAKVAIPAQPSHARLLYNWRRKVAGLLPLDINLPAAGRLSGDDLHRVFLSLRRWMSFWIVVDNRERPVGWFELDSHRVRGEAARMQGWVEPGDYRRRWLCAQAIYKIARSALQKEGYWQLETSFYAAHRDLLEACLLGGFLVEGISHPPGADRPLVFLSASRESLKVAPALWLFGGFGTA